MKSFQILFDECRKEATGKLDLVSIISKQLNLPVPIVKKGIKEGLLTFNNKIVHFFEITLHRKLIIKFQNKIINLPKIQKIQDNLDVFVRKVIGQLNIKDLNHLPINLKVIFLSYVLEYFEVANLDIDSLTDSEVGDFTWNVFENCYAEKFRDNSETKIPKRRELVNKLLNEKNGIYKQLDQATTSIENNFYDLNKSQIFQDFNRLFSSKGFKLLILPLLGKELDMTKLLHSIINSYKSISALTHIDEKLHKKLIALKDLEGFKNNEALKGNRRLQSYMIRIIDFITLKCKEEVGFSDNGKPNILIEGENRTYDFSKDTISIHGIIQNIGSGIAKNICVTDEGQHRRSVCEFLPPSKKMKIHFDIRSEYIHYQGTGRYINFTLDYENEASERFEKNTGDFTIKSQQKDLPWEDLNRTNPYSIQIVNDPDKLFGREKFIEDLRWNIEQSSNILSYVIYGQKRVGKSSIVRTLDTIFASNPDIIYIYKTVGDIKQVDAFSTFQKLSKVIFSRLTQEFRKRKPGLNLEYLASVKDFDNSFSGLIDVIDELQNYSNIRIIIALDEFDELNNEFFENSELGKTFALNIGKGMNERSYVGFILVGSETMEQKTKQGMRLNAFELKKVDTFDRQTEFDAYSKIITEPTKSCLKFSDEVIEFLFDYTNGNPYFTNLLMGKVFREAYEKKISFLDSDFVSKIIHHQVNNFLSQKDFQHFWDDALSEEAVNYEKILDRRRRVLTAFSEAKKEKGSCTWSEMKKKLKYPKKYSISENQMEDTLNEFKQRNIIISTLGDNLEILPKLFEDWILGQGLYQVIAQLEDKDEILDMVQQESKLFLKDEELDEINTFINDGNKKKSSSLRLFLDQFESNADKRLVADLLTQTYVLSASEAIEFLKKTRKAIWNQPIQLKIDERNVRKDAELFCSRDTFPRNKQYLEIIKTEFRLAFNKKVKFTDEGANFDESIKNIIFFEPIIDCPFYYRNEISKFLKKISPQFVRGTKINIISFIITEEAKEEIEKLFSDYFTFDFEINSIKLVQRSDISPYFNMPDTINNQTWRLISNIYKNTSHLSCLVKIGELVPYQTFPFLWSNHENKFTPLFSDVSDLNYKVYDNRFKISEELKSLKFDSETKNIEFKASLSEPSINWKQIHKLSKTYKAISNEKLQDLEKIRAELDILWHNKIEDKTSVIKKLRHSIAKTIAAFANSSGGDLYVGIEDDFTVKGLVNDLKLVKNNEGILGVLDDINNRYLGKEFSSLIKGELLTLADGTKVLNINVKKSNQNVWVNINDKGDKLDNSNCEFYVRNQQETIKLGPKEMLNWEKNKQ